MQEPTARRAAPTAAASARTDRPQKYFFLWCALRRALRDTIIIHENVQQFGIDLLQQEIGEYYYLSRYVHNAADLGWASVRIRQMTICILKTFLKPALKDRYSRT